MEILGGPLFAVAGAGESHGPGVTTIVFGCPPGLRIRRAEVQEYLEVAGAFGISRIAVPDRFKSMTLSEAGFAGARDKYGVSVIALRRGEEIILRPDPNETMKLGDALVLAGPDELVRRITD